MLISNECSNQSIGPANEIFGALIQTILAAQCAISSPEFWPKDYGPDALKNGQLPDFDAIVVGAGSAGSVVAARLSENLEHKILLLEAGSDPPAESEIPNLFFVLQNPNYTTNWGYYAEKSDIASKSFEKGVHWPRGKMLGGSHGTNSMIYVRGHDRDFNGWESKGNPTWGYENVLSYFKKSEGFKVSDILENKNSSYYHNTDGPIKIDSYHNKDIMKFIVTEGAIELGYKFLKDINANETIGIAQVQGTLDGNRRCSTAKAFLVPAKDRPNLFIIKNAHVTKVNINEKNQATGVEFIVNNKKLNANAKKEVILSAGAINTPQILMLSGIGPKEHLKKHEIDMIVDLPVGKNLQDHAFVELPLAIKMPNDSFVYDKSLGDILYKNLIGEYGPSGNGIIDLLGFFNTKDKSDKYPDIQTHYVHIEKNANESLRSYLRNMLGYNEQLTQTILDANKEFPIILIIIILLNPKSKGEILLRSTNPFDHPIIDAGYLSNLDDLNTLLRGIRLTQKFIKTQSFQRHNIEEIPLSIPECGAIEDNNSDEYYECIIRHLTSTLYHPSCTAKMGPDGDPTAVVDSRLRVKGVTGLRVADASIMPDITSGNTNAPVIMIGEKCADFIKEDWATKVHSEL